MAEKERLEAVETERVALEAADLERKRVAAEEEAERAAQEATDLAAKEVNDSMEAINAVFKTENIIDQKIKSTMYLKSFKKYAKAGNFTLANSIHQMKSFAP